MRFGSPIPKRCIQVSSAPGATALHSLSVFVAGAAATLGGSDESCDDLACEIRTTERVSIATYIEGREGRLTVQSQERLKRAIVIIVKISIVNAKYYYHHCTIVPSSAVAAS